jgi:hypothetical protein
MADSKSSTPKRQDPPTNHEGQVANQETSIRDAKVPDEKPDQSSVAQVEEIKE